MGMECGVRKCGIMLVPTTLPSESIATLTELGPWQLHGQDVPIVDSYRYLGYEFTNDLMPDRHMELRREGARKAFATCMPFSEKSLDTVTQSGGRIQGHGAPHPHLGMRTPSR